MTKATHDMLAMAGRFGPAQSVSKGDLHYLVCALDHYEMAKGSAKVILGRAIVRRLKKIPGWRSPYAFFKRTNSSGSWVLVSYHHRAQLCWEWSLWLSLGSRARCTWKPWRWVSWGFGRYEFGIPWLFRLNLYTQRYGWMLGGDGKNFIQFAADAHSIKGPTALAAADSGGQS